MGLIKQGAILGFARLTNYAVMFLTPILLVRMLDMQTYGQYREFMLYATVLFSLLSLAIRDNLNYIVSVRPADAPLATTQTILMLLATTTLGIVVLSVGRGWFLSKASFDFLLPLIAYVFLVINFDVLENYWLGKQQARNVLIYSTGRILLRVIAVLLATYLTHDLNVIIWAIVAAEAFKAVVCFVILVRLRLLVLGFDRALLNQQLQYIVPLSMAGLLFFANEKIGHVYISATAGATALALYTVGTYQLPFIAIARSAVADTLFPEMVRHFAKDSHAGLDLWRIANLYYVYLILPLFCILFYFAEEFITLLFTMEYLGAVDVFRVALLVMLRQTFEVGTPLRAANQNRHMLWSNLMGMCFHLPLLVVLTQSIGIAGAALAWLSGDIVIALYLGSRILKAYRIPLSQLACWAETLKISLAALLLMPALVAGAQLPFGLTGVSLAIVVYLLLYLWVVRSMRIPPIDRLVDRLSGVAIGALQRRFRSS